MKYQIEFTKKQISCVATALEFYSRFLAGQWRIPDEMEFKEYELQDKYEGFWEKRNYVEDQLNVLKSHFTGLHLNASYGIGSNKLHENAKIAYDVYRPVYEEFNKNSNTWNVFSSPGLTYSKEGRINIKTIKDE